MALWRYLGELVQPGDRAAAARALARAAGADDLLVLVQDTGAGVLLPAPGFRKTLPGGPEWRAFLGRCTQPGIHRATLRWSQADAPVVACSCPAAAALFVGGHVADEHVQAMDVALPTLAAALRSQQEAAVARGELASVRFELKQSTALMRALDESRRELDRSLAALNAQARVIEIARLRAEDAARAKDHFLAMLGHELRNPLAPIVSTLEVLRLRGQWTGEHDIIRRQVDHMMRLVDDLLDVARIAGGKLALERRPVALRDVVERAVESVEPMLESPARSLDLDVDRELFVDGDPARLTQVVSNLLTNALKYSDAGSPVALSVRREDADAVVEVIDRGIGIEPSEIEAMFELFEQQSRSLARSQGGLGLGLAIVRNLVQLHGGTVGAYSEGPGRGSTFTVRLPLIERPAAPVTPRTTDTLVAGPVGRGRVLVVDDNADAALTLAMALEMAGYEPRTAGSALAALELVEQFRPHAAVLDIGLPDMTGYELAARLRAALGQNIMLVAVTGYGQPGDRQQALAAGFDAHLVKPVDIGSLCRALGSGSAAVAEAPGLHV